MACGNKEKLWHLVALLLWLLLLRLLIMLGLVLLLLILLLLRRLWSSIGWSKKVSLRHVSKEVILHAYAGLRGLPSTEKQSSDCNYHS